jgi:hypothetical protein
MAKKLTNIVFYSPWERKRMARIVFTLIGLSLLWSFFSSTLLHQLQRPVIKFPYVDLTYWGMHWLGIPEFLTSHFWAAGVFDLALFAACILSLLAPEKRLYIWSYIVLYFIYFITFNTFGTHHTNHKIGLLLIAIPFTVTDYKSFNYLWQGLRYFLLFTWADAFLWKFFRLAWLHTDQGISIMKKNVAAILYFEPNSWKSDLYRWLLQHPGWVNGGYIAGVVMEAVFIIGFFTRKYDTCLFVLSMLLPIGFWLIADAYFFQLMILNLTLINFHAIYEPRRFTNRLKKGDMTPV